MENRATASKTMEAPNIDQDQAAPAEKDGAGPKTSADSQERDSNWQELGATRVVQSKGSASPEGDVAPEAEAPAAPLVLGKNVMTLGDFRLVKKLGEGAMGAVYKAQQVGMNRIVAIKILFPHVASNPKLVERLRREGLVMGQFDHPNIVQAYAVGEAEGCHYVAMEYVPGQSMQKWIAQLKRVPVADAVRVVLDCARALDHAHSLSMVHRDIKPDNILLTKGGVVKLADFGMVKMQDEDLSLTQTGHAVGTPWFMPLEQARNAKEIDGRSDIYALGCTLYALITGNPPFMGNTLVDVIRAKEAGTFPPARQFTTAVPERLDLIIAKMTAKLPKTRYQTCAEVVKDLESLRLASPALTFLKPRSASEPAVEEVHKLAKTTAVQTGTPEPMKTQIAPVSTSEPAADNAVPLVDPNLWYVQMKDPNGEPITRQYTTEQLEKMFLDGTISPNAKISQSPDGGFRAASAYREFSSSASIKMAKKAADKQGGAYRSQYKQIEEEAAARAAKHVAKPAARTDAEANREYWTPIVIKVVVTLVVLGFLAWAVPWAFKTLSSLGENRNLKDGRLKKDRLNDQPVSPTPAQPKDKAKGGQ